MKTPPYCYDFPRPALTVDMVVYGYANKQFHILLIQRKNDPFKDKWALPGGFVDENETAETAAYRELEEETNLKGMFLEQLYTVSELNRDPRGRTVSVVYYTYCHCQDVTPKAGDDAKHFAWYPVDDLPAMAFDHHRILQYAREHLIRSAYYLKIGPQIMRGTFTKDELIDCYEAVIPTLGDKAIDILQHTGCIKNMDTKNQYYFDLEQCNKVWQKGFFDHLSS